MTLGSLESLQSEVSILTKLVDDLHQLSLSDASAGERFRQSAQVFLLDKIAVNDLG